MNSVTQAAALNSSGVQHLLQGNATVAISCFQNALLAMKSAANVTPPTTITATTKNEDSYDYFAPLKESERTIPSLQDGTSYVYDHALIIDDCCPFQDWDDLESVLPLYSSIILFNLALGCHQMGRYGNDKALLKAVAMYKMSIRLLKNVMEGGRGVVTSTLVVLCLNNIASIFYEQGDFRKTQKCLEEMRRILCEDEEIHLTLHQADLEGITLNAMLLHAPTCARAA